jgi:hypothetical protein
MRRLKERLTFANVTAATALFIALGGTSYAAITLPRNSVGTNQLRTGAIRSVDVKDRTLEARDLSVKARRFLKGRKGDRGERGLQGPAGSSGQAGATPGGTTTTTAAGVTLTIKSASFSANGDGDPDSVPTTPGTVTCDAGQNVTGGGVNVSNANVLDVHDTHPVGSSTWSASVGNDATTDQAFTVYAICAR